VTTTTTTTTTTTMPDTPQSPRPSPGKNGAAANATRDSYMQQPHVSRTRSRYQPEMECRCLMDHVGFERPDDGDEFDEPQVTGG